MIVYATELPAAEGTSLDDIETIAKSWLCNSPHYPWQTLEQLSGSGQGIDNFEESGHQVWIGHTISEQGPMMGVRHQWTEDENRVWTTEIVAIETAAKVWVTVRLSCGLLQKGLEIPYPKKPYIVKALLENIGGGNDGPLTVIDRPHRLNNDDLSLARDLMLGTAGNRLPVIYVSADFTNRHVVDIGATAKWVSGLAHVVVEPSRTFSFSLASLVGRYKNAYGGAIGLYWPEGSSHHRRYFRQSYSTSEDLVQDVVRRLRATSSYAPPSYGCSWPNLRQLVSARALELVRKDGSSSVDDYVSAFDEELSALNQKLVDALAENLRLRALLHEGSGQAVGDAVLERGEEQDLYEGEISDIVLSALDGARGASLENSRRRDVLDSLLKTRQPTGKAKELTGKIKSIIGNVQKITPREVSRLESLGFAVTDDGKHYKAVFGGDGRYTFSMFKTASDHRAGKNLAGDINKKLFK